MSLEGLRRWHSAKISISELFLAIKKLLQAEVEGPWARISSESVGTKSDKNLGNKGLPVLKSIR